MSIDLNLRLPPNVRVRDVAKVIGKLLGAPARQSEGYYVDVEGYYVDVEGVKVDSIWPLYHFEHGNWRLIILRSTPKHIALARAIADFFGGEVDYSDVEASRGGGGDYVVPSKSDEENHPTDGEPWYSLQNRILTLKPLSKKSVEACKGFAAYPDET